MPPKQAGVDYVAQTELLQKVNTEMLLQLQALEGEVKTLNEQ